MFASSFQQSNQPTPLLQTGVGPTQLRTEDTITELCHAAEVFIPRELNRAFRLRRTFIDIGGTDPQRVSITPNLTAHQYVHARKQAARMADAAGVSIERCVPIEAVGFSGLKKRFEQQEEALKKQQETTNSLVDRINREELLYRDEMEERFRKLKQVRRSLRTTLIDLFRELDESRTIAAAEQGRNYQISSYTGSARDKIGELSDKATNGGLKNRIMSIEKKVHLQDRQRRPQGVYKLEKSDEEELYRELKQLKLGIRRFNKRTGKWERDMNILKKRKRCNN